MRKLLPLLMGLLLGCVIFTEGVYASTYPMLGIYDRETLTKLLLLNNSVNRGTTDKKRFTKENVDEYVDALLYIQKHGIDVDASLVHRLSHESAKNKKLLDAYVRVASLPGANIRIDDISAECVSDERFVSLVRALYERSRGKQHSSVNPEGVEELRDNTGKIRWVISSLCGKKYLDGSRRYVTNSQRAVSKAIDNLLYVLANSSIRIRIFDDMSSTFMEKIQNDDFVEALIMLARYMQENKIPIDSLEIYPSEHINTEGVSLAIEFVKTHSVHPRYIMALAKLYSNHKEQITPEYVSSVLELYRNGVLLVSEYYRPPSAAIFSKVYPHIVFPEFRRALYRLHSYGLATEEMATYLSPEKARDERYINSLIELVERLLKPKNLIIAYFTEEISVARLTNGMYRDVIVRNESRCVSAGWCKQVTDQSFLLARYPDKRTDIKQLFYQIGRADWGDDWSRVASVHEGVSALGRFLEWYQKTNDSVVREIIDDNVSYLRESVVKKMNELHERPDTERLAVVKGATAYTLYYLVARSDELYTSTLNLLVQKFSETLAAERKSLPAFIKENDSEYDFVSEFIFTLARFGKLAEMFQGMDEQEMGALFTVAVRKLERAKSPLEHAFYLGAGIGDVLSGGKGSDRALVRVLEKILFEEREKLVVEKKDESAVLLDIIISLYADRFSAAYQEQARAFRTIYGVDSGEQIDTRALFGSDGTLHTQMFFYNDKDGFASFNNFIAERKKTGWEILDREKLVVAQKSGRDTKGALRTIKIYANKPAFGIDPVYDYVKKQNISIRFVIHRGHSYHTRNTLLYVDKNTAMVFLGSCGGFKETGSILQKNINMLVFGSRNIGTMHVNDPLLNTVDLELLSGKTNLREIWEHAMGKIADARKEDYIPPYENVGPKIYRAYEMYKKQNGKRVLAGQ